MPATTPQPLRLCPDCGRMVPQDKFRNRAMCGKCYYASQDYPRGGAPEPEHTPPPKPRGYTIDELPACPHCHERSWELHREHEGYEAWCPCGYIAYETKPLPLVRERLGEHGEAKPKRRA